MLLILLLIKHFLLDFPFQTPYMLRKSQPTGWFFPLFLHAAAHGAATFILLLFFAPTLAIPLALAEGVVHFGIDYWKAQKAKAEFASAKFWTYLGLDQLFHNLTYVAIIFIVSLYMTGL
jgi:hypothetical protein